MIKSTTKFKVDSILFNDGSFAIAKGYWNGQAEPSVACRWHEDDGIGYPQTFGKPQWMVMPSVGVDIRYALDNRESKVVLPFC